MSAYVASTFATARRYLSRARLHEGDLGRRDELVAQAMRERARAKALRIQEAAQRYEASDLAAALRTLEEVQRYIDLARRWTPSSAAGTENVEESPFFWLGSAGQGVKLAIDRLKGAKR